MRENIREELVGFVVENYLFGESGKLPGDGESLIETGVIDSTGVLELIEFLEDRFGIQVLDSETVPANLGSIANLIAYVERKRS